MNGNETKNTLTTPLMGGGGIRSKKGTFILQKQGSYNLDSVNTNKNEKQSKVSINEKSSKIIKQGSLNITHDHHSNSPQNQQNLEQQKIGSEAKANSQANISINAGRESNFHQSNIRSSKEIGHEQSRKSSLHTRRLTNQYYIVRKEFDPFKSPPDLSLAENHKKARLVGWATEEQKLNQENYCPCCYSIIEKNQFNISCDEKELAFLGVGYAQIFLLNKFFGFLIVVIFVLGGSLLLFVKNQINCYDKCLSILGIGIMANKEDDIEQMHPFLQILMAMFIIASILYAKKRIQKRITKFNEGYVSPCEYTIMVQNLPLDARKEELKRHFQKLMNRQIITVNMAYDIEKYNEAIDSKSEDILTYNTNKYQIKQLQTQLESQQGLTESKKEKIMNKINQIQGKNEFLLSEMKINDEFIDRFEKDCDNDRDPSKFLGTAFITFNDTVPVNSIVDEWGYTWINILKFIFFRWVTPPFIEYKEKLLIIRKAPAPADIIWENLRFSLPKNIANNTFMLCFSFIILYICFKIQFLVMYYIYPLKKQSYEEHSFILMIRGSLLSICVVIVNLALRNTMYHFTKFQRFDHHTKLLNAYINKYIFLYFFNSAFMPYVVHAQLDQGNINIELLVWDIHFIIIATSISTPLSKVFDPVMFYKLYKRWRIKSYPPEDCPYTQKEANMWFEGHPIEIADSYAYIARNLFLSAWYAQVAPFGIIFSMLGLICNHYIDKYCLLRIHPTPELITEEVYSKVIFALDLIPFIYLCGCIEYNLKNIESTNVFAIIFNFITEGGAIVGLFLSLICIIFHYKRKTKAKGAQKENRPYNEVRTLFPTEYDRCNPVTASKASIEYIKFLYNQKAVYLSANMQEMIGVQSHKKGSKKKRKSKKQIVDGTNLNHLLKSGSQQYQEKFLLNHQQSKSKLLSSQNLQQYSSYSSSSDSDSESSDSDSSNNNDQNETKKDIELNPIQLPKNIEESNTYQANDDQSNKARNGTLFYQRQSIPTIASSFQNFIHGHSTFYIEHTLVPHNQESSESDKPLDINIQKVESKSIENEEELKTYLEKNKQIESLKNIQEENKQTKE
ncbi:transmembrane protein, putative (macronuclear) [Tetrahymena thermophila SB210]|uniref:Transmembrane protein, putative n=1 Tax=Tetrahymena thermophila (strain SB210) TaxID=312017 RepID=Q22MZ7_TETTS|nr:transmembrane protein, putative [Tetrahymena thermophila SB210]EAR86342.2 transmembrane protein, putative [Tetrahymena thermophila SB210]|eukprot:XP_976873.2 transmembrane protein, putative [Tetrahymena thermophila SB210]